MNTQNLIDKIPHYFAKSNYLVNSIKPIIEILIDSWELDFVEFWVLNASQEHLRLVTAEYRTSKAESFYKDSSKINTMGLNKGLPGAVWAQETAIIWKDLARHPKFIRSFALNGYRDKTVNALGIPLFFEELFLGTIVLGSTQNEAFLNSVFEQTESVMSILGVEIYKKINTEDLYRFVKWSPLLFCTLDLEGKILSVNVTFCNTLELTENEVLGLNLNAIFNAKESELIEFKTLYKSLKKTNRKKHITQFVTQSGKRVWLEWEFRVNEDFESVYATAKDISEEFNLKELLSNASELVKIGAWEIDLIQNTITWSKTVYEIHEVAYPSFKPSWEEGFGFYKEEYRDKIIEITRKAIQNGAPFEFEAPIITAKENEVWIRAVGKTVFQMVFAVSCMGVFRI